jgi:hypothetical protein
MRQTAFGAKYRKKQIELMCAKQKNGEPPNIPNTIEETSTLMKVLIFLRH